VALVVSICAVCGGAVAAPVETCYACDVAGPHAATSATGSGDELHDAPSVLTVRDFAVLERFARLCLPPDSPAALAMLRKLDCYRIVRIEAVPANIATLGSRVVFSVEDDRPEARVLVLPTQHAAAGWTLPVTAPRGMALLGRPAGAVVSAARCDGGIERLRLLAVVQQPESGNVAPPPPAAGHADAAAADATPAPRPILYRSLAQAWPVARQSALGAG
jgi:regulator of nucleoside diphosphate kinase